MPAKPSKGIKTRRVRVSQKNGDIYIYERKTVYDPVKKYNRVLRSKLIEKIPKGSSKPPQTHRRPVKGGGEGSVHGRLPLGNGNIGMMDIIDYFGKTSGIDTDLYASMEAGFTKAAISVARYFLATDGRDILGLQAWQYSHKLPYIYNMSERVCIETLSGIGSRCRKEEFFRGRCSRLGAENAVAYASIAAPYNPMQWDGIHYKLTGIGYRATKRFMVCLAASGQPLAYIDQYNSFPGFANRPYGEEVRKKEEKIAVERILSLIDQKKMEIVISDRYCTESKLAELLRAGVPFIVSVESSVSWVRDEIDAHMGKLASGKSACHPDASVHGVTVMLMHDFGKYNGRPFIRRIYLHLYFSPVLQEDEKRGEWPTDMEKMKYYGYFVLISQKKNSPSECLRKYRAHERIGCFMGMGRQHVDARALVWKHEAVKGFRFVQFLTLCYYEHIRAEIEKFRDSLGKPDGNPAHDTEENLSAETRLGEWLDSTPVYQQLQWFDTGGGAEAAIRSRDADVIARDKLYLEKIGMDAEWIHAFFG